MSRKLEHIRENWRHGTGPCSGCPMRDSNLKWSPYYGDGVVDADVAFIAETPGQGSEDRDTQTANAPNLNASRSLAESLGRRSSKTKSEDPIGTLTFDLISHNRIPRRFFEIINGTFRDDWEGRRQIYFTNSKKCQDIVSDDEDWKNDKGYIHCRRYIKPELEVVDPNIVIPLGEHATDLTFHSLDADWTGKLKTEIPLDFDNGLEPIPEDTREVGDYNLIPSYHWSYVNQSKYKKERYWEKFGELIVDIV